MSSNRATNNDSCRDLNGRRLSTIKEAKKLASYLEAEPNRQAAAAKATQTKLDELNAEIARLDAISAGTGGKRRLDDNAYVEQSRNMVEGVKDAVREAMLAKRKKAKLAAAAKEGGTGEVAEGVPVVKAAVPVVEGVVKVDPSEEKADEEAAVKGEEGSDAAAEVVAEVEKEEAEPVVAKPKPRARGRK